MNPGELAEWTCVHSPLWVNLPTPAVRCVRKMRGHSKLQAQGWAGRSATGGEKRESCVWPAQTPAGESAVHACTSLGAHVQHGRTHSMAERWHVWLGQFMPYCLSSPYLLSTLAVDHVLITLFKPLNLQSLYFQLFIFVLDIPLGHNFRKDAVNNSIFT